VSSTLFVDITVAGNSFSTLVKNASLDVENGHYRQNEMILLCGKCGINFNGRQAIRNNFTNEKK